MHIFLWMLTFTVFTRLGMTLFDVPHRSFGGELSNSYSERTNIFARKLCDEIDQYVTECKMDSDMTYYHFLFHLKQRTIHRVSYPLFKAADKSSTNEVTENMSKYLSENSPELKLDASNNTIQ